MTSIPHPRIRPRALAVVGLVAVATTACNSATNELKPSQEHLTVADRASIGKVLTDDEGRTLYLFDKDEAHESYCTGACASVWPPVTTKGMPVLAAGLDASKVTLIKRDDSGLMQVAYNGHPLYYYQADTSNDDAYGQEKDQFGAEWYAVSPTGGPAEAQSSNDNSGTGGGGSGSTGGSGGSYG